MFDKKDVRILIVDDEPAVRNILSRIIVKEGYMADTAGSGKKALSLLAEKRYNVVLTDLNMPEFDGTMLMKQVKERTPFTEVIILTGHGTEEKAAEAVRAHAFDYLQKPVDAGALLESISGALGKQFEARKVEQKSQEELMELNRRLALRNEELEESNEAIRAMQSQLLQHEKMAAIGQLAAGVAHEINNPISFVHSNLGTLKRYVEKIMAYSESCDELLEACSQNDASDAVKEKVGVLLDLRKKMKLDVIFEDLLNVVTESQEGSERVRKIVVDLKSFSRADDDKIEETDINEGLETALGIVWNELKYKATVRKDFGDIPRIRCHPMKLTQVFMNIMVNAAQAMEEHGEIFLRTAVEGDNLLVEIEDTGQGIAEEHLSRLFEPFFTTKPAGMGTGLGLSIAYEIINKHGGTIAATSKLGEGTTFTIKLPLKGIEDE